MQLVGKETSSARTASVGWKSQAVWAWSVATVVGLWLTFAAIPACGWSPTLWASYRPVTIAALVVTPLICFALSLLGSILIRSGFPRDRTHWFAIVLSGAYAASGFVVPVLLLNFAITDNSPEGCATPIPSWLVAYLAIGLGTSVVGPVAAVTSYALRRRHGSSARD